MQQENAGLRLPPIYILCILQRVSLVNHSIFLTQTIRGLHLLTATQCNLTCRLSKPPQGNDNLFIFCLSYSCFCTKPLIPSVKVKPSKKARRSKPAEEPILAESELRTAAADTSVPEPPPEPAHDAPTSTTDPSVEQTMEGSENPEIPSSAMMDDPEVEITRTDFVEPGRPTALAKCSAKEELL